MPLQLLCRKVGNTQIFTDTGECIPVTVLEAGANTVVQKKTEDKDGYTAVQLGFGDRKPGRTSKGVAGHHQKSGAAPHRHLRESRVTPEEAEALELGHQVKVDIFSVGEHVDVTGTSKGRGFAGVVKRHNFAVKRRTHGTHENTRHGGAIGAGAYPGRVIKGMKMAGQLGAERVTVKNLEVVRIDGDRGLLYVRGSVPGHRNGLIQVRTTKKTD
ncbi:MAG: 50S ribosomal protein L3 [Myxococcota bacterium]|nr:50S ribosomal protein L3 [Deltaproteobacteria bacterium]MCP4238993.1 50S ribosomal protein L3 [bacterium]MDP6076405.1 50S ribosomal protein L3 [Myxococcota bacterium]MDP6243117.1 50S ribosomal protein L3 [Myxococcota bacterium]MDP7074069.1 50S ribosomal protein L3 [Myxococcota bacterium]